VCLPLPCRCSGETTPTSGPVPSAECSRRPVRMESSPSTWESGTLWTTSTSWTLWMVWSWWILSISKSGEST
ncbi:ARRB1 isoform 7, partial [Pongo abelii]